MFRNDRYAENNGLLNRAFSEKNALVAVHRGAWGGNIIENTIPAYEIALSMGADMFECDLSRSTDGTIYIFHDGGEFRMFGEHRNIKTMDSARIDKLVYLNSIGQPSGVRVARFRNELSHFAGTGKLFNVDRAWDILPHMAEEMRAFPEIIRQAVVKTPVRDEYLDFFSDCPDKFMYMPIAYTMDEVLKVFSRSDINLVGVEVIAGTPEDELIQEKNIRFIRDQGLYVWVNSIVLSIKPSHVLCGGLDDDKAMLGDPDASWGELFRRGVNVVQTDWPVQLKAYRDAYFKRS